jgi:hypothetical protein
MRGLVLAAACVAGAVGLTAPGGVAAAESNWLIIKADSGAYGYDAGSMEKDAATGEVVVTVGMYLSEPATWGDVPYSFMIQEAEFDCVAEEYTAPLISLLDDNMEPLDVKQGTNWAPVQDNGVAQVIFDMVCNGRKIPEFVPAGDDDSAMRAMKAFFK